MAWINKIHASNSMYANDLAQYNFVIDLRSDMPNKAIFYHFINIKWPIKHLDLYSEMFI